MRRTGSRLKTCLICLCCLKRKTSGALTSSLPWRNSRCRHARAATSSRVVSMQPQPVQVHFYSYYMTRAHRQDSIQDLERHIRHMFYEEREEAKAILSQAVSASTLPALFRVIAITDEGWLAGELIRIVLSAPPEELVEPIRRSLWSEDYLLQCLAIYLVGKSQDERLLDLLARFYRKPQGDKLDRLEKKGLRCAHGRGATSLT